MARIAIDFGTSYSLASWINPKTKMPETITFQETGTAKMPSIVYYKSSKEKLIGQVALDYIKEDLNEDTSENERKELLGHMALSVKSRFSQDTPALWLEFGKISFIEVVADILRRIVKEVEDDYLEKGGKVDELVLSHPVGFAQWQKKILTDAAVMIGITNTLLIEEPIAAILGYSLFNNLSGEGFIVYDFGGGTFDAAYVRKGSEGSFSIPLPTECIMDCGGDDIDKEIYKEIDKFAKAEYGQTIYVNGKEDLSFLLKCRKEKEDMSNGRKYEFNELLPLKGIKRLKLKYSKDIFESIVEPTIRKTIAKVKVLINKIKQEKLPLDKVVLVGGSSFLPSVTIYLQEILPNGVEVIKPMNRDMSVVLGAIQYHSDSFKIIEYYCGYCGKKINSTMNFCPYCSHDNKYLLEHFKIQLDGKQISQK